MNWDYRVCVHLVGEQRFFGVREVYYDAFNNPTDYSEYYNSMSDWDDFDQLKDNYALIGLAFTKPIIDLDNFPNIFVK